MNRDTTATYQIGLLATGDEISNGDILNTNSQEIARQLFKQGMHIGMHMVTSDLITDIEQAINFLLKNHQAIIITGGLGPTSDDLTRFALGQAVQRPLTFDEPTWDDIVRRLKHFGYDTPPESNRQQALFPEGAEIIANPNGTAAGCIATHNNKLIFMLPGPPAECLPMFRDVVLPRLVQNGFQQIEYHKSWLLFGVSEGHIAEILDAVAKPYSCVTGYRLHYPYIEFKIHGNHADNFSKLLPLMEETVKPYLIGDGQTTASDQLRTLLETTTRDLIICDLATGGLLETTIKTPKTCKHLHFTYQRENNPSVVIEGLQDYWQHTERTHTILSLQLGNQTTQTDIPFRGSRVKQYAVEYICWKILDYLQRS